jgi:membrane protein implicated in regulation of membrane protease activity
MSALPWFWIWLVLAAVLYVSEMLSLTFFLLPFGVGATAAFIACALGAGPWVQWALFVVVSIVALIVVRPILKRMTAKASPEKSGVDRLVGLTGHVIDERSSWGANRARIESEVWNIVTETGGELAVDTPVRVLRVDGVHLVVEVA